MDLAQAMIELLAPQYGHDPRAIEIKIIGAKAGEKMYEELISREEMGRSMELKDMFIVMPAFRAIYHEIDYTYTEATGRPVTQPYDSSQESPMTKEEIKDFLIREKLLPGEDFSGLGEAGLRQCVS
jgi:FlaA1/EpsC-like NDP-sugar epimerase